MVYIMTELFFRKTHREFSEFVSGVTYELIILSPYIKLDPLKLLLKELSPEVKVIVVAKWKLSDLIFGSSDIEVFGYLKELGHSFYVNRKIHLKVIVKDNKEILLGSANITGSGLGLFEDSNIEAIAIDNLDEKYLPSIHSILRESILVDDNLFRKIKAELELYKEAKVEQDKVSKKLEKIEESIFVLDKKNILVDDFIFSSSPVLLLNNLETGNYDEATKHDLVVLKLKETKNKVTLDILKQAFLSSEAYTWQKNNINKKVLFGKYSELLHNALVDSPKPYRKQVKELVASMFTWTKEFSNEFDIVKHTNTSSMVRK